MKIMPLKFTHYLAKLTDVTGVAQTQTVPASPSKSAEKSREEIERLQQRLNQEKQVCKQTKQKKQTVKHQ
jgi:hypothetical protein